MNQSDLIMYIVIAVSIASLAYGSYTDVRRRTIKSLLFVPLTAAGFALNFYNGSPELFLFIGLAMFILSFLAPDTYAYGIVAFAFFLMSLMSLYLAGFYWGFQLLVMSLIFLIGFQERLFGIGDIKAIISIMYSNILYSPVVAFFFSRMFDYSLMPTALALLINISVFAIAFIAYAIFLASRHGTVSIRGQPLAIKYDPELLKRKPAAFSEKKRDGTSFLVYRIPFIVPVFMGYLLFLAVGFWPLLL